VTKFESKGVELQQEAVSKFQAEKRFSYSCSMCCRFGLHIECDRCAINVVHSQMIKVFQNAEHSMPAFA